MKKFYSLALLAAVSLGAFAQQEENASLYLETYEAQMAFESDVEDTYSIFYYNEANLMDSMAWSDGASIHSNGYGYDGNGNLVRMRNYTVTQDAFETTVTPGFLIEYDYDEEGRIIERRNYNVDYLNPGQVALDGRIVYSYDEANGNLLKETVYVMVWNEAGTGKDEAFGYTVEYSYDENNRLVKKSTYGNADVDGESTEINETSRVEYTYDDQGRLFETLEYVLQESGTALMLTQKSDRTYDENGNIYAIKGYQNRGGAIDNPYWVGASETRFTYDESVSAEGVVYPYHREAAYGLSQSQLDVFSTAKNLIVKDSTWLEFDGAGWNLSDIGDYTYSEGRPTRPNTGAVESVDSADEVTMVVVGGRVYLYGVEEGAIVNIYDAAGRVVLSASYTEAGIPVERVAPGVKILKTGSFTGKFM